MGPHGVALILWLALGAWAMRSAGCVWNDIVDRDLDARVERTRLRPLASGRASLAGAWVLLVALCLIGLLVLLQLGRTAQIVALASLAPVAAYPFMKRITWWPQAWLGLVFSWGALVGWPAVRGELEPAAFILWAGLDLLGDRLRHDLRAAGPRGRCAGRGQILGARARPACPDGGGGLLRGRARAVGGGLVAGAAGRAVAGRPAADGRASRLAGRRGSRPDDGGDALAKFRSNRMAGLILFLACLVVGTS